jgi:hypothetical protein
VLSTLAHELGHGVFDAPGWISNSRRGPGLFNDPAGTTSKAYRTTTRNADHLNRSDSGAEDPSQETRSNRLPSELEKHIRFAELRANEFMGSLLVPRIGLIQATQLMAPGFDVRIAEEPSIFGDSAPGTPRIEEADSPGVEALNKAIAQHFGVNRRFIQVRMERYGLLNSGATIS